MTVIAPALDHLSMPIGELRTYPANPRRGDVAAIAESLQAHGQYRPIVAQADGTVLAGNHTLLAARSLGWDRIAAVKIDVDDETARRIVLVDNRSADLGSYDAEQLADLLTYLSGTPLDLVGTGWDADAFADLLESVAADEIAEPFDAEDDEPAPSGKTFDVFSREIVHAHALSHYLGNYPYRSLAVHECMQEINALAALPAAALRFSTLGYAVADTYNPHRLSAHTATQPSPVDAISNPVKIGHGINLIMDAGSAISDSQIRGVCGYVRNAQACANFRPGFALSMFRRFAGAGSVVLDTSTGYGGRLVGFLASDCAKYIGIDPQIETCAGNQKLARDLLAADRVELICKPAEDVELPAGIADFAFTSPPYFSKEHYSDDDTQSFKRYPTGNQWRAGFLIPMIALQFRALKPGAYSVINISDVTIDKTLYPLVEWTIDAAHAAGFELEATETFPLGGGARVPGRGVPREASEPLLIFRKPAA